MSDETIKEMMLDMLMHNDFHIPIVMYGYDCDGTQVLIKKVDRRKEGCPVCNKD